MYPMTWQHIFIPILPMPLIDYLLAPMPFLIGVPEQVLQVNFLTVTTLRYSSGVERRNSSPLYFSAYIIRLLYKVADFVMEC